MVMTKLSNSELLDYVDVAGDAQKMLDATGVDIKIPADLAELDSAEPVVAAANLEIAATHFEDLAARLRTYGKAVSE